MDTAVLEHWQTAAVREQPDISRRNISHDVQSIVNYGYAGQALVAHQLKSVGEDSVATEIFLVQVLIRW